MKKIIFRVLQVLVTVGVLAWVFRDPAMRAGMAAALRKADPKWITIGIAVAGAGEVANIWRWGIFLKVQGVHISWRRTAELFMVGVFFGLFLLGTAGGDVMKVLLLVKGRQYQKSTVFLTVVADRLSGLFVLVPFSLAIVGLRYGWMSQTPAARGLLWVLVAFAAGCVAFIGGSFAIAATGLMKRLPVRTPGREKLLEMAAAYDLFRGAWRASLLAILLSFPVLFTFFGTFYCAALAFHANISLPDMFSIMPVVTVISSLPVSVSGLGVREEMFKQLLGDLAHVSGNLAVLISLTGFLIYVFWSILGGIAYLWSRPEAGEIARPDSKNS